jgi:hypothetical protein
VESTGHSTEFSTLLKLVKSSKRLSCFLKDSAKEIRLEAIPLKAWTDP